MTDNLDIVRKNYKRMLWAFVLLLIAAIGFSIYVIYDDAGALRTKANRLMVLQDKIVSHKYVVEEFQERIKRLRAEVKAALVKECPEPKKKKRIQAIPTFLECPEPPRQRRQKNQVYKKTFKLKNYYGRWQLASQAALKFATGKGFNNVVNIETIDNGYTVWHVGPKTRAKITRNVLIEEE